MPKLIGTWKFVNESNGVLGMNNMTGTSANITFDSDAYTFGIDLSDMDVGGQWTSDGHTLQICCIYGYYFGPRENQPILPQPDTVLTFRNTSTNHMELQDIHGDNIRLDRLR
jgi:hypothetical protein